MKKYLLLLILFLSFSVFSQEKTTNCKFEFDLKLKGSEDNLANPKEASVDLNWDFSKLNLNKTKVTIEIVPVLDCFNDLNASNLKDVITVEVSSKEFKSKDSKNIKHLDLMAKCFKYRVVLASSDCNDTTDWKFYSYF